MTIKRADNAVRLATSDILSRFLHPHHWEDGPFATLRNEVYSKYAPGQVPAAELHDRFKVGDVKLKEQHRFLYLEPVEGKGILPFVTIQSSCEWVNFRIYALLGMLDKRCEVQTLAIRFETDEGSGPNGGMGSHDFCHAQLCKSITKRAVASTPSWLPESQPSIPVDAEDQIGLVLCMLTSLYGARHVLRKLNTSGDRDLRKYLNRVRALRDPTTAG